MVMMNTPAENQMDIIIMYGKSRRIRVHDIKRYK